MALWHHNRIYMCVRSTKYWIRNRKLEISHVCPSTGQLHNKLFFRGGMMVFHLWPLVGWGGVDRKVGSKGRERQRERELGRERDRVTERLLPTKSKRSREVAGTPYFEVKQYRYTYIYKAQGCKVCRKPCTTRKRIRSRNNLSDDMLSSHLNAVRKLHDDSRNCLLAAVAPARTWSVILLLPPQVLTTWFVVVPTAGIRCLAGGRYTLRAKALLLLARMTSAIVVIPAATS